VNKILLFFLIFGVFNASKTYSQHIEQQEILINKKSQKLLIPYKILDSSSLIYEYNIRLMCSQDGGKSFSEPLRNLEGHAGENILAGENKVIIWNYLQENPHFIGENIQFKIWATYKPSVLNLKGPEAAFYSLLVPGLGNTKVRFLKPKWSWLAITIPTYGLIATSFLMKSKSNDSYSQYQNAQTNSQANNFYQTANNQNKVALIAAMVGGAIWAVDIIQVAIKGKKNQKAKSEIYQKNKAIDPNLVFNINTQTQTPQLSVKLKF
jgi:hypothetical protein